jgi:hypothetical protein
MPVGIAAKFVGIKPQAYQQNERVVASLAAIWSARLRRFSM